MAIRYQIDTLSGEGGRLHATGWAVSEEKRPVTWTLSTKGGHPVQSAKYYTVRRPDIGRKFFSDPAWADCGFEIEADMEGASSLLLRLSDGTVTETVRLTPGSLYQRARHLKHMAEYRLANKPYEEWLKKSRPGKAELSAQKTFQGPLISVVVPVYRTPVPFLKAMIASLQAQTYGNWQLCLSNAGARGGDLEYAIQKAAKDSRIVYEETAEELGISDNTNRALALAKGEWIAFMDHDDELEPHALYEVARQISRHPETVLYYTDEDKMSAGGEVYFEPHFKPDYDPELLSTNNYISHLTVVKKAFLDNHDLHCDARFDGSQDYDLLLRMTKYCRPGMVRHIPQVLYHWRSHLGSTAAALDAKQYTFEAGYKALCERYADDPYAKPAMLPETGYYEVKRLEPDALPFITVVARGLESLSQVKVLEEEFAAFGGAKAEVILEMGGRLNRRPRGEWVTFYDVTDPQAMARYEAMAVLLNTPGIGGVTGLITDGESNILAAGIHREGEEAVLSFSGYFEERVGYGNLPRIRHRVYAMLPDLMIVKRSCYEAAGSPAIGRLSPEERMAAGVRMGAAAVEQGLAVVYEPRCVLSMKAFDYPERIALPEGVTAQDPYFPATMKQGKNGNPELTFGR